MRVRDHLEAIFQSPEDLDLTSGGIAKPLFYLSVPIVITNVLQVGYNLADTFWLGQYDTTALAAISFAFPMVFFLIALAMGLSVTGSVLVAQYVGAGEEDRAEYAASQTVSFSVVGSLLLGAVAYLLIDEVLVVLGASEAVAPLVAEYMRVYSLGLVAVFGFFVFVALMRGYGDTVTPMLVMAGSVALNVVADPFLIFGFEANPVFGYLGLRGLEAQLFAATGYVGSGVEGAALATVVSRALALVVGLAIMFGGTHGVQIRLSQMTPDLSFTRRILEVGTPASVEGTARALSINLLLIIIAAFPETVVAAFGVGTRVFSVVFLPAIAFSQGIETMTGQNIGAGEVDRAERANHFGAKVMFAVLTAMGVLAFLAAAPIVGIFTTDPAVVDVGATFMRITALTFGFTGILRAYSGGFRGAGKTLIAAAIAVVTLGIIRFPLAWIWSGTYGEVGIWYAFAVSNVAGAIIGYLWFQRGTWRESDLTRRYSAPEGSEVHVDD